MDRIFTLACLLVLLGLSACNTNWFGQGNANIMFDTKITLPVIPALNAKKPSPLTISFPLDTASLESAQEHARRNNDYQQNVPPHALRLDENATALSKRVSISPHVEGNWSIDGDTIVLQPNSHWPANVSYTLKFSDDLFMDNVIRKEEEYKFTTKGFSVQTTESRLYFDPTKPGDQRYISTLQFSHPITPASLPEHYAISIPDATAAIKPIAYSITPDKEHRQKNRVFHINSEQIALTSKVRYLTAKLPGKFKQAALQQQIQPYKAENNEPMLTKRVEIPSTDTLFHVEQTEVQVVINEKKEPQKALVVQFSSATSLGEIRQHLNLQLLPDKVDGKQHQPLTSAEQITTNLESVMEEIPFSVLPTAESTSKTFILIFTAPADQQMLVHVKKGMRAAAGYTSSREYTALQTIPRYPTELAFLGEGSVLDSNGSHKIGFTSRNVSKIKLKIGRINQNDLHHLISQTGGNLNDTNFQGSLGIEDVAVIFEKALIVNNNLPQKNIYSSYDLSNHLSLQNESHGVFVITATGTNDNDHEAVSATRLILITDIGFIVKNNNDHSRDIFVQKISTRSPLSDATVSILGRNGRTVFKTNTDSQGHAIVPNLSSLTAEKNPVAILVTQGSDFVYLPTTEAKNRVNYSRYETGGRHTETSEKDAIRAFMFTDRGIYRPGEPVNIAAIVRDEKIRATKGFNVQFTISDPLGTTVYRKSHSVSNDGFLEVNFDTTREFNTGVYTASLSINANLSNDKSIISAHDLNTGDNAASSRHNNSQFSYKYIGSVEFSVEEFQPDRLKINTTVHDDILKTRKDVTNTDRYIQGWLTSDELKFNVSLKNLFGTAAQDRKITANANATQTPFTLAEHPGYRFSDVITQQAPSNVQSHAQPTVNNTDTEGNSTVNIKFANYFGGTYRVDLQAQGFEENGGRSVHSQNTVNFSPREYLIGYKAKNLDYLKSNKSHNINLLCVDKYSIAKDCPMQLNVVEINYVSTLVKQANGTYQYQTIEKTSEHSNSTISIGTNGYSYPVDTSTPGTYSLELIDEHGEVRQKIAYTVIGNHNPDAKLDTDARLELSLNKSQYKSGDWIELQIKAPYVGSGLISIESDRTHAFSWFTATTKQSVQKIQVPDGLLGNAYVQVAFIRSPSSKEIFTAPLSYSVASFNLSQNEYKMDLTLLTPDSVRPGDKLKISYNSSEPGRALIIAVDEGILQAANYVNPNPLAFFMQRRALQVETQQMFDRLLPEFELLKKRSASGGDIDTVDSVSAGSNLNPFARKTRDPVTFWSGIVQTDQKTRSVEFDIPDHFDGTVRVMSIALNERHFAKATSKVIVKGPFIVTPSLPVVVAPGDTFVTTVGVSNQLINSANNTSVDLSIEPGPHFEVLGEKTQSKTIREGDESTFEFTLKATDNLGSAQVRFLAQANNQSTNSTAIRNATSTISIRPATLLQNELLTGKSENKIAIIKADRKLFENLSSVKMTASVSPTLLIDGLISYLDISAHACTEQIVSKLSPVLAYYDHPNFLGEPATKQQQVETLFTSLRARQLPSGGFSLWPGQAYVADIPSVHVLHALIDAEDAGISVPSTLIENGESYLREFAYNPVNMEQRPELSAYALYLLTRRGELTNNALIQLQTTLQEHQITDHAQQWQQQLVAAYMAASYKILRRDEDAIALINQYKFKNIRTNINHYDSALYRDAMAIYLLAQHFEKEFKQDDAERIESIIEPVFNGSVNTLSSGRALIALKAYSEVTEKQSANVTFQSTDSYDQNSSSVNWTPAQKSHYSENTVGEAANFDHNTEAVKISSDETIYYQLSQIGFDIEPPETANSEGLEITKQLLNTDGKPLSDKPIQGEDILVRIKVRSTSNEFHKAIAIVDLLPGGFEIDRQSVRDFQSYDADYIDIREDRLVVYASIGQNTVEISYKARLTTSGEFTVPAVYANAMYNDSVYAHSNASSIHVQAGL